MIEIQPNLNLYNLKGMQVETLVLESECLKNNPLNDSCRRVNPVLRPLIVEDLLPVIFVLSGFSSNGGKFFNFQSFEMSSVELLVQQIDQGLAPKGLYVFVDAWTFWGGSQYINSLGCGQYEDYIVKELVPAILQKYPVCKEPEHWFVVGGSSGGYGAIHLASQYSHIFGCLAAIAPDCFFRMSLLPEIFSVFPHIEKWGGVNGAIRELQEGLLLKRKDGHKIMNVIAMGLCYAGRGNGEVNWPIQPDGSLIDKVWSDWESFDPIMFLPKRKEQLSKLKSVYLDVGKFDQYHLQYGARQLKSLFQSFQVKIHYSEYKGNHFDIGKRRSEMWKWLNDIIIQ